MKKGIASITGNTNPIVGEPAQYKVHSLYEGTPRPDPNHIKWIMYYQEGNQWIQAKGKQKTGAVVNFTFSQLSLGRNMLVEAYLHQPEAKPKPGLVVVPQPSNIGKLTHIALLDSNWEVPTKPFAYGQSLIVKAYGVSLDYHKIIITLWEDDVPGAGHSILNQKNLVATQTAIMRFGVAETSFTLSPNFAHLANAGYNEEGETHEYYVTAQVYKQVAASSNINVNNPSYIPEVTPTATPAPAKPTSPAPAKQAPAQTKGKSQKEEKGIVDSISQTAGEIWDWLEEKLTVSPTIKPDPRMESGRSTAGVGRVVLPRQKFDKVKEFAEEAVIYITNEIATAIEVDKNGKLVSYPDKGYYNGQLEFKEGDKIYCKKISATQSAFPTYKAYIYRGNVAGEAIKKLKQDIAFKTFENAESTVLELARHSGDSKNKNMDYGKSGPVPPNKMSNLYRLKYKQAWNDKGKESFRYRIVDSNQNNFPEIKDYKKEHQSGGMSIGSRGSISIDPWSSTGLIGCLGVRGAKGKVLPSIKDEINDQSNSNYKFIYHGLNNYLEEIIPELTGIYGRRGYSSSGKIDVAISQYEKETKVYVLIDGLIELKTNLFTIADAEKALKLINDTYGKEMAKNVEMVYRWENDHFKSGQYKHCGSPGMEVSGNKPAPGYGWDTTTFDNHPEYKPIGIWEAFENKGQSGLGGNNQDTINKKKYIKFSSVEAGMTYLAEFINRHNGNIGRWHADDAHPEVQKNYIKTINTCIPRISNKF